MQGFGVNAVGHERRTYAVPRHVAHKKAKKLVATGENHAEVTANRTSRAVVSLDGDVIPNQAARCEGLLDARSEREFGFNFHLALFKQHEAAPRLASVR